MNQTRRILPVDGYIVELNQSLPSDYMNALIHLYQPLIGVEAIGLYQTLLLELDVNQEKNIQTHHTLMNYLNMPLNKLYDIRLQLEAIGLLQTFKHVTEQQVYYTYRLLNPMRPNEFFQDMMLSELLYRHIGELKYEQLKAHYFTKQPENPGENVTVSFADVFRTFKPSGKVSEIAPRKVEQAAVPLGNVDFSEIRQALTRQMVPAEKVLTQSNQVIIAQLMHLYDLEAYEMENSILWALTDENTLDIAQLKAACHDLFQAKHNVANVQMTRKEKVNRQVTPVNKENMSREERLIQNLQVISPKQLLEDLSSGNNASEQDMKIISEVMVEQGLPTPVMNVLIHYVMLQSNMKLSKPYLEKIASHWSRAGLKTAKEAMDFAKNVNKPAPQRSPAYRRQAAKSKEVIPEWFKEREKQREETAATTAPTAPQTTKPSQSDKEKEAKMLAILEKYASKD